MSGASNAGERDYRETIAEMRKELVAELRLELATLEQIRVTGRWAPDEQHEYRKAARATIRRIRALDHVMADAWKWRSAVESAATAAAREPRR